MHRFFIRDSIRAYETCNTQLEMRGASRRMLSLHAQFTDPLATRDALYYPEARIACAVSVPFASAASTVPISRPAYSASPEKNTAPASDLRSADCASRVLGVA